jgi:hypothetical protein
MPQIVFRRGCGRGRNPPRSLQDRIARALVRVAVVPPASPAVAEAQAAVIDELADALEACNVTRDVTFHDAQQATPGYRPRPAQSRREELEAERQRLRLQLWGGDAADAELKAAIEAVEAELAQLGGR